MKILSSFRMFISQIFADSMLAVTLVAPFMAGAVFRFGIPRLERLIERFTGIESLFTPYYLLIDLFLCVLAPFMLCFASSMVMLEERDEGVGPYMIVTPVGKHAYLISRIVLPAGISTVLSAVVLLLFGLSGLGIGRIILISLCMPLISVILSLFITSFSGNRVEGMALAKLSGLILAGLAIPFFISGIERYYAAILPTFWIAEYLLNASFISGAAFFAVSALWLAVLYPVFKKKGIGG